MAKRTTTATTINLLTSRSFQASTLGRIFFWVLTIGKAIVFFNFFLVILGFSYRYFYLDRKLELLDTEIKNNVVEIDNYRGMENKIKSLQQKLDIIHILTSSDTSIMPVLKNIENSLPIQTHLERLTISSNQVHFEGVTPSEMAFSSLIAALKKQPNFSEIVIDELYSGGVKNPEVRFSITLQFKQTL